MPIYNPQPISGTSTSGVFFPDDIYASFGNTVASPDARLGWNTTQTVDAWYFGTADAQNVLLIAENGDRAFDFTHGAQTNPTVFIHSATQSTTQWLSLTHNQTNGVLAVGSGGLSFGGYMHIGGADLPNANQTLNITRNFTIANGVLGAVLVLGTSDITEGTGGVHPIIANIYLDTPTITAGVATVTDTAQLYITSAMSATVTGGNYSIFVDAGLSRFDDHIMWGAGIAVTAGNYSVGRDADATNQLHLNVPTGASLEFSINDVDFLHMSATETVFNENSNDVDFRIETDTITTAFVVDAGQDRIAMIQGTLVAIGAAHNAVIIQPTFQSENFAHRGLSVQVTQDGNNSSALTGIRSVMTKTTGATTLSAMSGFQVVTPSITGTVTSSRALHIQDQSVSGITTTYGILIDSQGSSAGTTRAIEISGTGLSNAIRLGGSPNIYSSASETIRFSDSTDARNIVFTLTAAGNQTIGTSAGSLELAVAGTSEVTLSATNFQPTTNDGNALGISGTAWADLFLALGAVINWNAANLTATHSASTLTLESSTAGTATLFDVTNADVTNANSHARIRASIPGASSANAYFTASESGGNAWSWGLSTAAGDLFLLSFGATIGNGTDPIILSVATMQLMSFSISAQGASTYAILTQPTFAAENFEHGAIQIVASQTGANSSNLLGIGVSLVKTAAGVLGTSIGVDIASPTVSAGSITSVQGIRIQNQSITGSTQGFGIFIQSQSANATTTRAIEIAGTGVNNAIRLGSSVNLYSDGSNSVRLTDSTDVRGFDFNVTAAGSQQFGTIAGNLDITVANTVELTVTSTAFQPNADDGIALGVSGVGFSDLFLASGAVVNFSAGDVTLTHSTDTLTFAGGRYVFNGRIVGAQGADVASASNLTLGTDGNVFEITGTTTIDRILSTNWQEGSTVTLIFNESVTVNHATATSGSNITILLAGAANFAATANDTLTLVLSSTTAGGQAWREIARAAI